MKALLLILTILIATTNLSARTVTLDKMSSFRVIQTLAKYRLMSYEFNKETIVEKIECSYDKPSAFVGHIFQDCRVDGVENLYDLGVQLPILIADLDYYKPDAFNYSPSVIIKKMTCVFGDKIKCSFDFAEGEEAINIMVFGW